ncbi:MAG: hypothetical protein U0X75_01300 [Acidobacteriota bacterium]
MKKQALIFWAASVFVLMLTCFHATPIAQAQELSSVPHEERAIDWLDRIPLTLIFDVATDARSFRLNRGAQLPEAKRGDSFIVEGKIYPGGTIAAGGTLAAPGPFNPITATGSIGKWVLRGTFNYDFGEIIAGAEPAVFGTQYFLFDDGRMLVTEGAHAGLTPQLRALVGGGGYFSGASGDVLEQVIGTNVTGLFNQRFTFKVNRQSIR